MFTGLNSTPHPLVIYIDEVNIYGRPFKRLPSRARGSARASHRDLDAPTALLSPLSPEVNDPSAPQSPLQSQSPTDLQMDIE